MTLSELQTIQQMIQKSKRIVLIAPPQDKGDALSSLLAWKILLENQGALVTVHAPNAQHLPELKFLPGITGVKTTLKNTTRCALVLDIPRDNLGSIQYRQTDKKVVIYLTPQKNSIHSRQLETIQTIFSYDLIIIIGSPSREGLGETFFNNQEFFCHVPTISIGYDPMSERYGTVNIIDPSATSNAEVNYKVLSQLSNWECTPTQATNLLTGMIIATKSFKSEHVTPRALQLASELVQCGGDREKIIHELYRSRSITTLKLWGRALSNLRHHSELGLISTIILQEDLVAAGAKIEDLHGVVEELLANAPEAKITLIIYETPKVGTIEGILGSEHVHSALELLREFNPSGDTRQAIFSLTSNTIHEAHEQVLDVLRKKILPQNTTLPKY
jgi:nanoRNase/pAp phosphatase (c-di-AMP/oligoRNAs hydrolase)